MTATAGYIAILVSTLGFGSNYVPVKRCHTGNGLAFQFFFCWSVLLVGLCVGAYRGFPATPPLAMLGGALWCTGNILSVPCIKLIGLSLGILLWGLSNMLVGWASGTFGLFGLDATPAANAPLNYAGVAVAVLSLLVYLLVQPEDHAAGAGAHGGGGRPRAPSKEAFAAPFHSHLLMEEGAARDGAGGDGGGGGGGGHATSDRHGADVFLPGLKGPRRFVLGAVLSLVSGCFYGASFDPAYYILDHAKREGSAYARYAALELADFVWPHFYGVFACSSLYFLLYLVAAHLCGGAGGGRGGGAKKRGAGPEVYPAAILPAFLSGGLWAVAMCAWFVANENLSMVVTFPIITSTPGLVASLWGVLAFKEIKGRRNLLVLGAAFCLTVTACLLIGFSM